MSRDPKKAEAMRMWTNDIERAIRAHAEHIDAGSNHDADEFDLDPEYAGAARYMDRMNELFGESLADPQHSEADARCARCSEGEDIGELVADLDQALIAYADRALSRDPVWNQLYAVRQAMVATL